MYIPVLLEVPKLKYLVAVLGLQFADMATSSERVYIGRMSILTVHSVGRLCSL